MKKIVALLLVLAMALALCGCSSSDYKKAQKLFEERQYEEALAIFEELGEYQDSKQQVSNCKIKICETLIDKIGFLSKYDPSYSSIGAAEKALSYYDSLTDDEKTQVSNKSYLPSEDELAELRTIRQRKDAEEKIEEAVMADAVKTIKSYLKNPSSYQERTDRQSYVFVLWDEEDPTRVHGNVYVYYNALNDFGGRIDSSVSGTWTGTYKNGIFTLDSSSVGLSMALEALR